MEAISGSGCFESFRDVANSGFAGQILFFIMERKLLLLCFNPWLVLFLSAFTMRTVLHMFMRVRTLGFLVYG